MLMGSWILTFSLAWPSSTSPIVHAASSISRNMKAQPTVNASMGWRHPRGTAGDGASVRLLTPIQFKGADCRGGPCPRVVDLSPCEASCLCRCVHS